ncbi:MAG TPA: hypothetical protein VMI31_03580, partial [Fimbriimonadaceae bacterium]|nr:hypothetical protein [Fimbriimonadaceae bacterium]
MVLTALLLLSQASASDLQSELNTLAQKRDVAALTHYLEPLKGPNPFQLLKTGGAYGVGRFGWKAVYLNMLGQSYFIFTTDLTSEDIGELLFRLEDGKLVYIPEDYANAERINSHVFDVRFDLAAHKAIIKDTVDLQMVGRPTMTPFLRIGPNYRVTKIVDGEGKPVAFLQGGGIICFPGINFDQKLTLYYAAIVNKPQYAGSVSTKEAMLTNDYWYPMVARQPAPYTLTVTVPKDWVPVGQGDLVGETVTGDEKKATFKMDVPVTYYSFSAAPYETASKTTGGIQYSVWSNSLTKSQMELQDELYPPIIEL